MGYYLFDFDPCFFPLTHHFQAACLYAGLFATALNNVMIGRANRALGPTVATFYMPLQPVLTVFLDYIAVNDAVYLGNLGCAAGVAAGLVAAVSGRHAGGRDRAAAAASAARRAPEGWWDEESDDEELLPRPGVAPLWTHAGGGGKG